MKNKTSYLGFTFLLLAFNVNLLFAGQEVKVLNANQLESLIENRDGRILLINVWATWCIPCREEFPDLVKIYQNYSDKVDVIGLSVDYEDEIEEKIIPFLSDQKVTFPVFVNGFSKDEDLINFFNKKWNGALPGTFIYTKEGIQTKFLEGKHSYESFSSILDELLK